jgi:hypothetical protein
VDVPAEVLCALLLGRLGEARVAADLPPTGAASGANLGSQLLKILAPPPASEPILPHPRGVRLRRCHIVGTLDLTDVRTPEHGEGPALWPFEANDCVFDETPRFSGARTSSVRIQSCWIPGFDARSANVDGELSLDGCVFRSVGREGPATSTKGEANEDLDSPLYKIDIDGATIAGDFMARWLDVCRACPTVQKAERRRREPTGLWFGPALIEIDADHTTIGGGVDIGYGGQALSGIQRTARPDIPGDPDKQAGGEDGADLTACIDPESLGDPNRRSPIFGNFDNTRVGGDFVARFAVFAPFRRQDPHRAATPDGSQQQAESRHPGSRRLRRTELALDLRGARIAGKVDLEYVRATGVVRLEDAKLDQDLEAGGAVFVNPAGLTLDASAVRVSGSVHLVDRLWRLAKDQRRPDPRFLSIGQVRLSRARIGADLDGSGTVVCAPSLHADGTAIDLRSAEVGGTVYLDAHRHVGPGFFVGLINMTHTQVAGAVNFAGSWFRAPAGTMMGPQWVDREIEHDDLEQLGTVADWVLRQHKGREGTATRRSERQLRVTVTELWSAVVAYPHRRSPELAASIKTKAQIVQELAALIAEDTDGQGPDEWHTRRTARALRPDDDDIWRLRGGFRAIAMVDAVVGGAVHFGTALDIYPRPEFNRKGREKEIARAVGLASDKATGPYADFRSGVCEDRGRDAASIVIGCVDMDRVTIQGDLRLSGGIFRAVTPYNVPDPDSDRSQSSSDDGRESDTDPPNGQIKSPSHKAGDRSATSRTRARAAGAEESLGFRSGVSWTETKKRVCVSLRGATITGCLVTGFFGAVPMLPKRSDKDRPASWPKDEPSDRPTAAAQGTTERSDSPGRNAHLAKLLRYRVAALELVPVRIDRLEPLREQDSNDSGTGAADSASPAHVGGLLPFDWAIEIFDFLYMAGRAEREQDEKLMTAAARQPELDHRTGGYRLRPDGQFDLRGASIRAIYDDPLYGWPTSDGHLALNGCTYEFLSLGNIDIGMGPRRQSYLADRLDDDSRKSRQNTNYQSKQKELPKSHSGHTLRERSAIISALLWIKIWLVVKMIIAYAVSAPLWVMSKAFTAIAVSIDDLICLRTPRKVYLQPYYLAFEDADKINVSGGPKTATCRQGRDRKSNSERRFRGWLRRQATYLERFRRHLDYAVYAQRSFRIRGNPGTQIYRRRILWLEQQYAGSVPRRRDFRPQPYEQLAKAMRATGYNFDADRIAAEKRRFRRRTALVNPVTWTADLLLGALANYGYSPARILSVIALTVALSSYVVATAEDCGLILYDPPDSNVAPLDSAASQWDPISLGPPPAARFQPLIHSIDAFVPVIEFGYAANWQTLDERDTRLHVAWTGFVEQLWTGPELSWPTAADGESDQGGPDAQLLWQVIDGVSALLLCIGSALVWLIASIASLATGVLNWIATQVGLVPEATQRLDLLKDWVKAWPPGAAIAWAKSVFALLGWLLTTIAVVTFTGVLRKD